MRAIVSMRRKTSSICLTGCSVSERSNKRFHDSFSDDEIGFYGRLTVYSSGFFNSFLMINKKAIKKQTAAPPQVRG